MRHHIVTLLAVLLVACGDNPTDPPVPLANQLRILNGPATCNSCDGINFTVAGPGLDKVIDATLKNHVTHTEVEISSEIRRFVGDSGLVLLIKLDFTASAPKGDYDLHLRTVDIGGAEGTLVVPVAIKITAPPPSPETPTPPPGPIGTVRVLATTSGPTPTADYLVAVDPCDPVYVCPGRNVGPNARVSIQLNPGTYSLALANLPSNCSVTSQASIAVTVVANQTTEISFSVKCVVVPSGSIRIAAPTTGAIPQSPYNAIVTPCDQVHVCSASVPPGGSGFIVQGVGNYTVSLDNVPSACVVADPRSVQVTVASSQTVDVSFSVTCPPAGTIHVTASVSGADPDNSYFVTEGECDYYYYCNSRELTVGGSADFSLVPGSYSIKLNGIAQNCVVDGANPRTVTVTVNAQTNVAFAVTCSAVTRIRVSAPTTGPDADNGYYVTVGNCAGQCTQMWLYAGSVVDFFVTAGTYSVALTDVASNCTVTGPNPATVSTSAGVTTDVSFPVTCTALPPPATIRVTAPTTGSNRDTQYTVTLETACDYYYGCWQQVLLATGSVNFSVTGGISQSFRLTNVASNCTVAGANPRSVTAAAGATVDLVFPVTCQ